MSVLPRCQACWLYLVIINAVKIEKEQYTLFYSLLPPDKQAIVPPDQKDRQMDHVTGGSVHILTPEEVKEISNEKNINPRTLNSK